MEGRKIELLLYNFGHITLYRTGGKFRAIPDFALFRKFRGY